MPWIFGQLRPTSIYMTKLYIHGDDKALDDESTCDPSSPSRQAASVDTLIRKADKLQQLEAERIPGEIAEKAVGG